ncbi:Lrp/AsnC family transcriptional regulator [Alcaligenes nematophilus]|jgi:DNA-binding Lrp family transcriptional regulator|uniref:Lrp/AsnC family transcriptional regulator n=3 Tax=Alcaligenes TaxID=507 RepID=A0AAE9H797_ALCFA|nr:MULTISPECIES: Lrp/AsnC family transcriptional regulator [Alcaligenes]MDH4865721.1 Lrp/AsnC family transcriptional regulator [Bacillus cereus]ASC90765.1 Lrp/AsnC family transcriptional regulator [Alcaligenes faecalis]KGP02986.1 AsnC family transcriptional regulator [Alcaligenes faecalis]KVX04723.1 AsnC family transcriptional regulator [Alcaligenes faecalis]MCB4320955.1 Lrp/AsnC family transcriptional regulator [Alcaligenes sp. 13f]
MQIELDQVDGSLLAELQGNARLTTSELAQKVGISQSPCWRRIRRMEEAGLISGYHARLDRRGLGYGVVAFVSISVDFQNEERSVQFVEAVRDIPEVVMCHGIAGPADFLLMVVAKDLDSYSELLQRKLHRLPGVRQAQTSFSLQEFKGLNALPIPAMAGPAA